MPDESIWGDPLNQKFPANDDSPGVTKEIKKELLSEDESETRNDSSLTPDTGEEPDYLRSDEFKEKVVMVEGFIASAAPTVAETIKTEMREDMTREQAVAYGRVLGELEADSRQEVGESKDGRVRRAMAYAAWEWDGKPSSSEAQRKEFGVTETAASGSMDRAIFGRLIASKKEVPKEKKKRR